MRKGRTIAVLLGLAVVMCLGILTIFWSDIVVHYHRHRLRKDPNYLEYVALQLGESAADVALVKYLETDDGRQALFRPFLREVLSRLPRDDVVPDPSKSVESVSISLVRGAGGTVQLRTGVPEDGFYGEWRSIASGGLNRSLALLAYACDLLKIRSPVSTELLVVGATQNRILLPQYPRCSFALFGAMKRKVDRGGYTLRVDCRVYPIE